MPRHPLFPSFLALAVAACSSPADETDAGDSADAASVVDAAPGSDSTPAADAEEFDAGPTSCVPGDGSCDQGEVCRPAFGTSSLVCQTPGEVALGGTCGTADVDDCVADGVCYDVYGTGVNTCRRFCTYEAATIACPGDNKLCVPFFGDQPAGVCIGNDCTPPAEGCGNGQRCAVFMGEVLACMPAGDVPVGGDCEYDFCVPGAGCVSSGSSYVCQELCDETADCDEGTHCEWPWAIDEWGMCTEGCDLISQTGCETAGEACYYSDPDVASTLCWAEGSLGEGDDCGSMEFCAAGLDCFMVEGTDPIEYRCRAYCDDAHPCDSGTCQATDLIHGIHLCL